MTLCILSAGWMFCAAEVSAQEQAIKLFNNLIDNAETARYADLDQNAIQFGAEKGAAGYSARKVDYVIPGEEGLPPRKAIRLEAKNKGQGKQYGAEAAYRLKLEPEHYYQIQGSGRLLQGKSDGAKMSVEIRTSDSKNEWVTKEKINGLSFVNEESGEDGFSYAYWLDDAVGKNYDGEIELALKLDVAPSYMKVGNKEVLTPEAISCEWMSFKIIDSAFKVVVGQEEKVKSASVKLKSNKRGVTMQDWDDYYANLGIETQVLPSRSNALYYMNNPGESGVNVVKIPALGSNPERFVGYFTTPLNDPATQEKKAYPRMFDFVSDNSKNLYNCTVAEAQNSVYRTSGGAISVIDAGPDHDTDWPNHVAIASATMGAINGAPVVNAFVHCENVWRATNSTYVQYGQWEFINFARSTTGSPLGHTFDKLTCKSGQNDSYPIITHEYSVNDFWIPNGDVTYLNINHGCGAPSVIEVDDYYYMIFHCRQFRITSDTNWESLSGLNRFYFYPGGYTGDGYYAPWTSICIARALKSSVNSSSYSSSQNPWVKYYERNANYWSEPGIGGKSSILWNAKMTLTGKMSELIGSSAWRAFPKVSINTFYQNRGYGKYLMLCEGSDGSVPSSVYLHNSNNLINWSSESILVYTGVENLNYHIYKRYPTLIGDTGQSVLTSEYNMLYYQRDVLVPHPTIPNKWIPNEQDLYRQTLRIDK